MSTPPVGQRPARTTPNLGLRVPGDAEPADLVVVIGAFLDLLDEVMPEQVQAARDAFAGAATESYVNTVAGGGTFAFTRVAGVPTRFVETRPDGSLRAGLLRYANDRLVSVTRYNPSQVDTLTYNGAGQFTGFTTA